MPPLELEALSVPEFDEADMQASESWYSQRMSKSRSAEYLSPVLIRRMLRRGEARTSWSHLTDYEGSSSSCSSKR